MRTSHLARILLLSLLVPVAAWADTSADAAPVLAQAKLLIKQNQADAAYRLLSTRSQDWAGNVDFDYLLGIAALDSEHATDAIFALERVVATEPGNQAARLELGRAYMLSGEESNAKTIFEQLKSENPPVEIQATVDRYLAKLKATAPVAKTTALTALIETGIGYNSNVAETPVPTLGHHGFSRVRAAIGIRHLLSPNWMVNGTLEGDTQDADEDLYDESTARMTVGLHWLQPRDTFSLTGELGSLRRAHQPSRELSSLTARWMHNLPDGAQIGLYAQSQVQNYPLLSTQDINRFTLGSVFSNRMNENEFDNYYTGFYIGQDRPRANQSEYFRQHFWGMRLGARWKLRDNLDWYTSGSFESHRYEGTGFPTRNTKEFNFRIGLNWELFKNLTLTPEYRFNKVSSKTSTLEFDKHTLDLSLRYSFQ